MCPVYSVTHVPGLYQPPYNVFELTCKRRKKRVSCNVEQPATPLRPIKASIDGAGYEG
jgi:hypothetical protein